MDRCFRSYVQADDSLKIKRSDFCENDVDDLPALIQFNVIQISFTFNGLSISRGIICFLLKIIVEIRTLFSLMELSNSKTDEQT